MSSQINSSENVLYFFCVLQVFFKNEIVLTIQNSLMYRLLYHNLREIIDSSFFQQTRQF